MMDTPTKDTTYSSEYTETSITATEIESNTSKEPSVEEFTISGDALVSTIKDLIHQGNIRRIIIKNEEGRTLIEIPLTVGVIGGVLSAALFPVVAAAGVIGAMVTHLTIVIERQEPDSSEKNEKD